MEGALTEKNAHKNVAIIMWIILFGDKNGQNKGPSQGLWANIY